jgi:hypothetical protein
MSIPVIPANAGIPLFGFFPLRGFAASRETHFSFCSRPSTALQALRINLAFGQAAKPRRKEGYRGIGLRRSSAPAFAGMTGVAL